MKILYTSIILFFILSNVLYAQSEDQHLDEQDKHTHEHNSNHHKFEIGLANSLVYFTKAKEYAHSIHLHLIYNIPESKFGIGLGVERINSEHKHLAIGLLGNYRATKELSFTLSPALLIEDHEGRSETNFTLHFETGYEFEIKNFHLGPVIGIAYEPEDYHVSLGVHVAYGF